MAEVRQRQVPGASSKPDTSGQSPRGSKPQREKKNDRGIGILDIIRVLVTLAVTSCGLSYYMTDSESLLWGYRPWFSRWPVLVRYLQGPLLLTPDQLAPYNGADPSLPIYLAVNGSIFDVSANPLVYGPGGHYSFFTGRDATRAFVTGCFQEDLTSDMRGVEEMFVPIDDEDTTAGEEGVPLSAEKALQRETDLRAARERVQKQVAHWQNFFRNHKKYFEVGRVVGDEAETGEKRELCEGARKQRPKRSDIRKREERKKKAAHAHAGAGGGSGRS